MNRRRLPPVLVSAALLVSGAAACAKDDGASTRSGCGSAASGSGAGSASSAGSAGGRPLKLTVDEYKIKAPATTKPGKVLLTIRNVGTVTHEVVVIKGVKLDDLSSKANGSLDEEKLPKGAVQGEVEGVTAGSTCDGTFDLDPGTYTLACNLVSEVNGKKKVHFMQGMSTQMEVR